MVQSLGWMHRLGFEFLNGCTFCTSTPGHPASIKLNWVLSTKHTPRYNLFFTSSYLNYKVVSLGFLFTPGYRHSQIPYIYLRGLIFCPNSCDKLAVKKGWILSIWADNIVLLLGFWTPLYAAGLLFIQKVLGATKSWNWAESCQGQ